ncbi:MAG: hypothetical protein WCK47_06710 [bacterium]|nr:hypothetical protein [Candidatus Sumerlaeota bacterium]
MLQDRFVKIMLGVIAALLALNLMRPDSGFIASPAQAQMVRIIQDNTPRTDVKPIKGYQVVGLKDVVAVGDGKSFVVSAADKFMVYQVIPPPTQTQQ